MKNLAVLTMLLLVCINCESISSSELIQTKAEDLKLTVSVEELNGESSAEMHTWVSTIPDDVEIQFNQGETLQVRSQNENEGFSAVSFMTFDEACFFGEDIYFVSLTKPAVGDLYRVSYTDKDELVTEVEFASEGVPELLTPTANEVVPLDSTLSLTWETQELGTLEVKVTYSKITGGIESASFTTPDTGSYELDLTQTDFNNAAPGEAIVELSHTATYTDFTGWGDALVLVKSMDRQTIQLE